MADRIRLATWAEGPTPRLQPDHASPSSPVRVAVWLVAARRLGGYELPMPPNPATTVRAATASTSSLQQVANALRLGAVTRVEVVTERM